MCVKADGDGDDEASETLEAASLEADADEDMPEGAQVDEPTGDRPERSGRSRAG